MGSASEWIPCSFLAVALALLEHTATALTKSCCFKGVLATLAMCHFRTLWWPLFYAVSTEGQISMACTGLGHASAARGYQCLMIWHGNQWQLTQVLASKTQMSSLYILTPMGLFIIIHPYKLPTVQAIRVNAFRTADCQCKVFTVSRTDEWLPVKSLHAHPYGCRSSFLLLIQMMQPA